MNKILKKIKLIKRFQNKIFKNGEKKFLNY